MAEEIILGIESSARMASVAVMRDGVVAAEKAIAGIHGHGRWIVPLIGDCLNEAGVDRGAITTVLGGCGPGSFTGIRVALAAAKGLMLAWGIEGRGICSLQAMAAEGGQHPAAFGRQHPAAAAVVETRRDSYFIGQYHPDGRVLVEIAEVEAEAIAPHLKKTSERFGISQWRITGHIPDGLEAQLHPLGITAQIIAAEPMARHLCRFYADMGQKSRPFEPLYFSAPLLGTK